ncbi:hypothetical protein P3385_14215 [Vibrio parahaemolyticus]|nr:hypothetical protein [Vibrio parahaemolyticus]MDF4428189.1 hypothetical protein [Vibrio parahaemolyticus]MDF4437572.1 hypothetical protein [Vibrio parahaemolyticus]MDF4446670.1 hypothetical protein [Vibrio parahaemolyticus]
MVGLSVSETVLFVKSQSCNIVYPKELFGVVSLFSTTLHIPSGFSDGRFETTPDLSFSKHVKTV